MKDLKEQDQTGIPDQSKLNDIPDQSKSNGIPDQDQSQSNDIPDEASNEKKQDSTNTGKLRQLIYLLVNYYYTPLY